MEITSLLFAGFVVLACLGYRHLPQRLRPAWLLLCSAVFLLSWSWKFLAILVGLALINFFIGWMVVPHARLGKVLLGVGIGFNLAALLIFKYSNFYLPALASLLAKAGLGRSAGGLEILAPLGLSFIVVQMISYQVDLANGRYPSERKFVTFALYVTYFPKILAGPIEREQIFRSRLENPQKWTRELDLRSFALVVVGLIRKLVIADTLSAMIPTDAFQKPAQYPAPLLAIWLVVYAFSLYNDFAGYSSLVRGISGFFGIELTNNFNIPYFARSFSEFWSRWHISLSNWLRDYIFFPISRLIRKKISFKPTTVALILAPLITMLVSGMWHGLAWNTLLWGGLQGCYLIAGQIATLRKPSLPLNQLSRPRQVLSAMVVFFCILMAWVPFHTNVAAAFQYWHSLFSIENWRVSIYLSYFKPTIVNLKLPPWQIVLFCLIPALQAAIVLIPALVIDWTQYREELRFLRWPAWLLGFLLAIVVLVLFLLSFAEKGAPFIYQSF
jgi:D-alanyl-lipoteichoic acid acyltransferase DltB (MBOAT superfamily)